MVPLNQLKTEEIEKFLPFLESNFGPRVDLHGGVSLPSQTKFLIPLQTPSPASPGKAFSITIFDCKLTHRHLLWHLMFREVTSLEWFLLYRNLEFSQKKYPPKLSDWILFDVLSLSSRTRERLLNWESRTKSIHRQLRRENLHREFSRFHEGMTKLEVYMLGLKVPQKGMSKKSLYISKIIEIPYKPPREAQVIGVGYKDKGSLGSGTFVPGSEPWEPDSEIGKKNFLSHPVARRFFRSFSVSP